MNGGAKKKKEKKWSHYDRIRILSIWMCQWKFLTSTPIWNYSRATIELGDVTPHNIKQLKKLNTVVFPVTYNDKFYIDVLDAGELAKLAYYNDIVVGAVCCRIDTSENQRRLYIMTLGCLYPYRRLGIGSVMVNHILNYVKEDGNFDSIFL